METLKEYIEKKEEKELDEELLNEDPVTIAASVLAIPAASVVVLWGASIVSNGYFRFLERMTKRIVKIWRNIFLDVKGAITGDRVKESVKEMRKNPKVKQQTKEMEQDKKLYEDELSSVLDAISSKDWNTAKEELDKLPKEIGDNPDVHKVIINEISKKMKEPPLYVQSPGNKTYQAIKKVINIRVARAAAMASKLAIEKNLKDDAVEASKNQDAGEQEDES